jgi:hypothetical protein
MVIRMAYNEKQAMETVGTGYHLVIPLPYTAVDACGGKINKFEKDQKVYTIVSG